MILGLGVARLLTSGVAVFRSRGSARLDWVPIAWAICVFIWQLQYWWSVIELAGLIETWTLGDFLILLGHALLLFVAAALVLPNSELPEGADLRESFKHDGRWALLFLSAYFFLALLTSWHFWGDSPLSFVGGLMAVLFVLPLAFLSISSRKAREVITVLYVGLSIWASWAISPMSH